MNEATYLKKSLIFNDENITIYLLCKYNMFRLYFYFAIMNIIVHYKVSYFCIITRIIYVLFNLNNDYINKQYYKY